MVARDGYIAVYMLASQPRGTLYIGVTSRLAHRVWEHREGVGSTFCRRYGVIQLVWYEPHDDMTYALQRERSLKRYPRDWKINLIERENPHWRDLYDTL